MTTSDDRRSSAWCGRVAPGFEPVREAFETQLRVDRSHSAQLAVYWRDEPVVDLAGGPRLDAASITGVFSVTKGAAALALGTRVGSGAIDLDERVGHYWPQFIQSGKHEVTVRQLLSHQAGLVSVDGGLSAEEVLDSRRGAAKLAAQRPAWRPGSTFGYHGVTIGIFIEELIRRVAGVTLQQLYESEIRAPRQIDFHVGLPAGEDRRYEPLLPPIAAQPEPPDPARTIEDGLESMTYRAPKRSEATGHGDLGPNDRDVRAAGPAAIGGVGSARGLARLYAAAQGFIGEPLLDEDTIGEMSQQQVWGQDRILGQEMCFGVVFQKPHPRVQFGSYRAFGHDGAGGALAFADPLYEMSFGYIPNPMVDPGGADPRAIDLSAVARRTIRSLRLSGGA
jgi:CubicO group peptidase (beta-lactamase class C family)